MNWIFFTKSCFIFFTKKNRLISCFLFFILFATKFENTPPRSIETSLLRKFRRTKFCSSFLINLRLMLRIKKRAAMVFVINHPTIERLISILCFAKSVRRLSTLWLKKWFDIHHCNFIVVIFTITRSLITSALVDLMF